MWELCHVLLNGTFFIFNLGENIGLVMVILNIQLFPLLFYLMHLTLEIGRFASLLSNTNVTLEFPDFSYEESQTAYKLSEINVMFF